MAERVPLGIEGGGKSKVPPTRAIIVVLLIVVLGCVIALYFTLKFYETFYETEPVGEGELTLPQAKFNDTYFDYVEDTDNDGYYNTLSISVGLRVARKGGFKINASLYDLNGSKIGSTYNSTTLGVGNKTITLRFEGLDIYLHRVNGSYSLKELKLYENTSWSRLDYKTWAWNTSPYNYTSFQNKYHALYKGSIPRSSREPKTNTTKEYSFEVKKGATSISIVLNITSPKPGDDLDLYLYYRDNEVKSSKHRGTASESVSLNEAEIKVVGYGFWIALIHNYSQFPRLNNDVGYCLTIDVEY